MKTYDTDKREGEEREREDGQKIISIKIYS